jgi:hypothetical protein
LVAAGWNRIRKAAAELAAAFVSMSPDRGSV